MSRPSRSSRRWRLPCRARSGATLLELILAAWLFGFVLLALARFAGSQGRLFAHASDQVRAGELARAGQVVLGRELRSLSAFDVSPAAGDSLRIRAVRGGGPVCGGGGTDVLVRYRGSRRPDPAKDSVLLVHRASAAGDGYRITGVMADPACDGGVRITLDRAVETLDGMALVFEVGTYSVSDGALRYRRGAGGRQPLTEALLATGGIHRRGEGGFLLRLAFHPDSLPRLTHPDSALPIHVHNELSP